MATPNWTTVAEAKQHRAIDSAADDGDVGDVLAAVEERIEKRTGVAWTPRVANEQTVASGSRTVWLSSMRCQQLQAVTVNGTPEADLAGWVLARHGRLRAPRRLPAGALVEVTYQHGADAPPHTLLDAALRATGTLLAHGGNARVGERTQSLVGEGQTINFAALPDIKRGRTFGMPDIDAIIEDHCDEELPVMA